ncbi:MAG: DUF4878 domain-containing protein [Actinobacteria bacterium]|nr:DUF4878 domain-containing protein [Actinomycetota bacterium]
MKKVFVLGCLLILLSASTLVIGCGGSGSSADDETSVKEVALEFAHALTEVDAEAVLEIVREEDKGEVDAEAAEKEKEEMGDDIPDADYKAGNVEIDGDSATVDVTIETGGETTTETIHLVKQDGEWKINLDKTFSEVGGE